MTQQKRAREEGRLADEEEEKDEGLSSLPKRTKASSFSELNGAISDDEDDDYTSSSGTSSSDDEEEEEEAQSDDDSDSKEEITQTQNIGRAPKPEEDNITFVPGRPKPKIQRIQPPNLGDESALLSRLSSFLPQLQAANADLEKRLASGGGLQDMILDDAQEGEEGQYIEMNLGLGVLKEKKKTTEGLDAADTSSASSESDEDKDEQPEHAEGGEGRVMDQLMGLKKKTKPGIQEVEDG